MQPILGKLLRFALADTTSADLHDRALLYYRVLSSNVGAAYKLAVPTPHGEKAVYNFKEDRIALLHELFNELDTLSITFRQPAAMFIGDENRIGENILNRKPAYSFSSTVSSGTRGPVLSDDIESFLGHKNSGVGLDGLIISPGGTRRSTEDKLLPIEEEGSNDVVKLALVKHAVLTPARFQELWKATPLSQRISNVKLQRPGYTVDYAQQCLSDKRIYTIASSDTNTILKMYLFGIMKDKGIPILAEVVIDKNTFLLNGEIRTEAHSEAANLFGEIVEKLFKAHVDLEKLLVGELMF